MSLRAFRLFTVIAVACFGVPAAAEAGGGVVQQTNYSASVGIQAPSELGPIDVYIALQTEETTQNGATVLLSKYAFLSASVVDPETGAMLFSVNCLFEPEAMSVEPLREASVVGGGACVNSVDGREVTFAVDLTWERKPSSVHYVKHQTERDAVVTGTLTFDGADVTLTEAPGLLGLYAHTDPLVSGVFVGGGGGSGNIDDTGSCFQGGVLGSGYDAVLHWALAENDVFHVSGSLDLTVWAVTTEGVEYELSGRLQLAESFLEPPLDEWGTRVVHLRLPVTLRAPDRSTVDAYYVVDLLVFTEPVVVYPLGLGVLCRSS